MNFTLLISRFLICVMIVGAGIIITILLARYAHKAKADNDPEHTFYQDADGNHSYYERSLIEKNDFVRRNPSIHPSFLRTFRRLIKFD